MVNLLEALTIAVYAGTIGLISWGLRQLQELCYEHIIGEKWRNL